MAERLLTTGEIARHCRVTTETVVSWIKSERLEASMTPGGRYRISADSTVRFLKEYGFPVPEEWESEVQHAERQEDQEYGQMNQSVLPKACLPDLVAVLKRSYLVYGPTPRGKQSAFEPIEDAASLQLDYTTSILPPKKFVLPPKEKLLDFDVKTNASSEAKADDTPVAVLGIHPCDMQGVLRLDFAFKKGHTESNYLKRRKKMFFIGTSCNPDEYCFCDAVGTNNFTEGFDLFLTDIGQSYLVDVFTERGRAVASELKLQPVTDIDLREAERNQRRCSNHPGRKLNPTPATLPLLLNNGEDLPMWSEIAKRCLTCGTCNLVCPTCYCFDVRDSVQLDLTTGQRDRFWDSCQLDEFAEVAGGESFREKREDRQKHRLNRKFRYISREYGAPFCVGCGRCSRQCVAKIDIVEIANDLEKAVTQL